MYPERLTNYFPGPNFWHAKESPDAPEHHETSGVVQPPLHATAALYVYRNAEDEANAKNFLEYAFSKLGAWHDYLYRERDPEGEGLVYIRHPWEERYWRGPVWINIDWFLMHGLKAYGHQDHAQRLRTTIIELCKNEGFHEYFDPFTGGGLGSILFSWSAALLLDVLMEEEG